MFLAGRAPADGLIDAWPNPIAPFDGDTLFPNWVRAPTAAFQLYEACDCTLDLDKCPNTGDPDCTESRIVGITIMNFGTASGGATGDIRNVYFRIVCGTNVVPNTTTFTMTYAGIWPAGIENFPTWTWSGAITLNGDPCGGGPEPGCGDPTYGAFMDLFLYTDISGCPTENTTVALGPAYDEVGLVGGIRDQCTLTNTATQTVPQIPKMADPAEKFLRYAMKRVDKDQAAPGDTVTYTIYYATPGVVTLSSLQLFDTIPTYMTVLPNSTTWFENIKPPAVYSPGPPASLLWSIPGPINPAGGATREVMFRATIDWGNEGKTYDFPLDSGNEAAPEGEFLFNQARVVWDPQGVGCPPGGNSNIVSTVVKRYLFWVLGDQDVVFAPKVGMDPDVITYSVYVKNLSDSKTWWNVRIWDTVSPLVDVWAPNMGFNDPFLGWTMTPTGAAAGAPGSIVSGTDTLLTWTTDMPPGFTLELKFKGQIKTDVKPNDLVLNPAMVIALGDSGKIGGTGPAKRPRAFNHEATVVLRTTFVSYCGWASDDDAWFSGCVNHLFFIAFYPLNTAAQFSVYRKYCCASGAAPCDPACVSFAEFGGVSPRIAEYAGRCTGEDFPADWEAGCKAERAPARYAPAYYAAGGSTVPSMPYNFLFKLVANSPVVWELSMCMSDRNQDADTFVGTSSMTFKGFIAYSWLRRDVDVRIPATEDAIHVINPDPDEMTSVFVFEWNKGWQFKEAKDIFKDSMWAFQPNLPAQVPYGRHYRLVSSTTRILAHKAWCGIGQSGAYNDLGTIGVCADTGNLINTDAPADFYIFSGHIPGAWDVAIVGNLGDFPSTYDIYRYQPYDPLAPNPNTANVTIDMVGNAGYWVLLAKNETVGAASSLNPYIDPANPNPHVYGDEYDASYFLTRYRLYKIVLKSGGPIMAYCGRNILDRYSGGAMLHPRAPEPGKQTGTEYWLHTNCPQHYAPGGYAMEVLDVFCPRLGQKVQLTANDGTGDVSNTAYITTDVDQCIGFKSISVPATGALKNWKIESVSGGDIIVQYIAINVGEKFYTAPFLRRGTYYDILTPPVVYAGQPFCMTIVVISASGGTKIEYCGVSDFTSTDPQASISGVPLDNFLFQWKSDVIPPTDPCYDGLGPPNGVMVFCNVIMRRLGLQTIIVSDSQDGSITGMAGLQVVGVNVKFRKEPDMVPMSSGDTVNFKICWSNFSSGSAFDFVVTDRVPSGFEYIPGYSADHFCGATYGFGTAPFQSSVAFSVTGNNHGDFTTLTTGTSPTNVTWLRWTIPQAVGANTTGCLCFKAKIQ